MQNTRLDKDGQRKKIFKEESVLHLDEIDSGLISFV